MINTNPKKIEELLNRGVEEIIKKESLLKKLKSGKKLRIKFGIDPTGPKIHIGRAILLWKLRAFQELGHQIVLIIGDFTAQIGDASDKQTMRRPLSEKEVKENMKNYTKQINKILDTKKIELHYNSEWLSKLKIKDLLNLKMKFTAQQMIQRRNFKERWDKGKPIGLHELDYSLFQGYDSVAIKADIEIGGFDQLFNLKIGREIQKIYGQLPQDIMVLKMLYGLDNRKMSTSWGNVINILDEPKEMYGKIMSMKDELIGDYFELCTQIPLNEIEKIKKDLKEGKFNPRDAKAKLAREVVKLYHGSKLAKIAEEEFNRVFKEKKLPSKIPVFKTSKKVYPILDLLFDSKLVSSKSEAKRVIEGGGVSTKIKNSRRSRVPTKSRILDGFAIGRSSMAKPSGQKSKIKNWQEKIKIEEGMVVQVGKRRFIKVKIK